MTSPATPERASTSPSTARRASLIAIVVAIVLGGLVAWAGSQNGITVFGVPLFALAVATAFLIQVLAYIPAVITKSEKHFDLTGGLTFVSITVALVLIAPMLDARGWVLAAMVALWALRLAVFLFTRIRKAGDDSRFDEIKVDPIRFLRVWVLQGLWVSLTASAAWIVLASPAVARPAFDWLLVVGAVVWVIGIVFEVVADVQKSRFRSDPANKGRFISSGLWSISRHPNYFGEILLWVGVFIAAAPALQGWQWVAVISPIFVTLLLVKVSGIPLLEKAADRKWGGQSDYEEYKTRTPVLVPGVRSGA